MSRNIKRRKKCYAAKYKGILPITLRFSSQDEQELSLTPHIELEKLHHGLADEGSFNLLALRLNTGKVIAENHHEDSVEPICQGMAALIMVRDRKRRVQKWGATPEECKLIGRALNEADSLQGAATRRIQRDAMRFVINTAGQAGAL